LKTKSLRTQPLSEEQPILSKSARSTIASYLKQLNKQKLNIKKQ